MPRRPLSRETLLEHRRIWSDKPELAVVYEPWFRWLLDGFGEGRRVLEVGAGPGFLADFARRNRPDLTWVASELLATSWSDVCADAGRLPFRGASFDGMAGGGGAIAVGRARASDERDGRSESE